MLAGAHVGTRSSNLHSGLIPIFPNGLKQLILHSRFGISLRRSLGSSKRFANRLLHFLNSLRRGKLHSFARGYGLFDRAWPEVPPTCYSANISGKFAWIYSHPIHSHLQGHKNQRGKDNPLYPWGDLPFRLTHTSTTRRVQTHSSHDAGLTAAGKSPLGRRFSAMKFLMVEVHFEPAWLYGASP